MRGVVEQRGAARRSALHVTRHSSLRGPARHNCRSAAGVGKTGQAGRPRGANPAAVVPGAKKKQSLRKAEGDNSFPIRLHFEPTATAGVVTRLLEGAKECIYASICFWH